MASLIVVCRRAMRRQRHVQTWRGWATTMACQEDLGPRRSPPLNTKGYSSTYLAMGFADVRAGTWYPPEH